MVNLKVNRSKRVTPMSRSADEIARALAMIECARKTRRCRPALRKDRTLQALVSDLVAARVAAGMTQEQVAMRMWTRTSAVSRLESGRYARPTLDTIQKYALAVGASVEFAFAVVHDRHTRHYCGRRGPIT